MLDFTEPTHLVSVGRLSKTFSAGASIAAQSLKYVRLAETIMEEQLGPERIATVFRLSASKTAKAACAFILLSGLISKYRAAPVGWSAQPEDSLCRSLVGHDFDLVSNEAAKFIAKHWLHIEALAGRAEAASWGTETQCPLWVISGHNGAFASCPLYPR